MKAAAIIIGLLAVDWLALLWTKFGLPSSRLAWQRIQRFVIKSGGFNRDH